MKATNQKKGLFSFYLHNMSKKNEGHFSYSGLTYQLTLFIPSFFVWCSTEGGTSVGNVTVYSRNAVASGKQAFCAFKGLPKSS